MDFLANSVILLPLSRKNNNNRNHIIIFTEMNEIKATIRYALYYIVYDDDDVVI